MWTRGVPTAAVLLAATVQAGNVPPYSILRAPSDLHWVTDSTLPGTKWARVIGDGTKVREKDVMMAVWDAGTEIPPHRHGGACDGVVMEGVVIVTTECEKAKELPSGSFFMIGGDSLHSFRCAPGSSCRIYISQPNARERVTETCPASR